MPVTSQPMALMGWVQPRTHSSGGDSAALHINGVSWDPAAPVEPSSWWSRPRPIPDHQKGDDGTAAHQDK